MKEPIRVLVVDDSPFVRRAVQRMLESGPGIEVVDTAANGHEGVEKTTRLRPDVVVLDIVMPELDGLAAIEGIMKATPTPILILSSHAKPGAEVTLRALELGAADFVSKADAGGRMDIYDLAPVLREKVVALAESGVLPTPMPGDPGSAGAPSAAGVDAAPARAAPSRPVRSVAREYDLVVLGASTGGPRALAAILTALPADFPAGIVIAQHMPAGFTATLAERLDRRAALEVREASDGDLIRPGLVLVGPGGKQVRVERDRDALLCRIPTRADRLLQRPSVDLLFTSAAEAARDRTLGLVLTGMGQDGSKGLAAIRAAGGATLVESRETAVIYGMPRAAAPHADRSLPLDRLPGAILDLMRSTGGG